VPLSVNDGDVERALIGRSLRLWRGDPWWRVTQTGTDAATGDRRGSVGAFVRGRIEGVRVRRGGAGYWPQRRVRDRGEPHRLRPVPTARMGRCRRLHEPPCGVQASRCDARPFVEGRQRHELDCARCGIHLLRRDCSGVSERVWRVGWRARRLPRGCRVRRPEPRPGGARRALPLLRGLRRRGSTGRGDRR
jgi:hypothetical protein